MNDEWLIKLTKEEIIDSLVAITAYMKMIDHSHKAYDDFIKLYFKFSNAHSAILAGKEKV